VPDFTLAPAVNMMSVMRQLTSSDIDLMHGSEIADRNQEIRNVSDFAVAMLTLAGAACCSQRTARSSCRGNS